MNLELLAMLCVTLGLLAGFYIVGRVAQLAVSPIKSPLLYHAIAPLLGWSLLALQLWLYGGLGIGWNRWLVLLPWFVIAIWRYKAIQTDLQVMLPRKLLRRTQQKLARLDSLNTALLIIGLIIGLIFLLRLIIQPFFSSDVFGIWGLKAQEFFVHESVYVSPEFYKGIVTSHLLHVDYPPLAPLMTDVAYVLYGQIDETLMKSLSFIFLVSGVSSLYLYIRSFHDEFADTFSIPLAFILLAAPQFLPFLFNSQYMAYADYGLGMIMLLGGICLARSVMQGRISRDWFFALYFAGLASVFKNEGLPFFMAVNLILAIKYLLYFTRSHSRLRQTLVLVVPLVTWIPVLCWWYYKHSHHMAIDFKAENLAASGLSFPDRLQEVLAAMRIFIRTNQIQSVEIILLLVGVLATLWQRSRVALAILFLLLIQLLAYTVSYVYSPFDAASHIFYSLDRLLAQLLPLIVLLIGLNLVDHRPKKSD